MHNPRRAEYPSGCGVKALYSNPPPSSVSIQLIYCKALLSKKNNELTEWNRYAWTLWTCRTVVDEQLLLIGNPKSHRSERAPHPPDPNDGNATRLNRSTHNRCTGWIYIYRMTGGSSHNCFNQTGLPRLPRPPVAPRRILLRNFFFSKS